MRASITPWKPSGVEQAQRSSPPTGSESRRMLSPLLLKFERRAEKLASPKRQLEHLAQLGDLVVRLTGGSDTASGRRSPRLADQRGGHADRAGARDVLLGRVAHEQ